jgi:hypothetical protein
MIGGKYTRTKEIIEKQRISGKVGYDAIPANKKKDISAKISSKMKGRVLSAEHKQRIGMANKGKVRPPVSEETRRKLRQSRIGKKTSEEARQKMSEVWLRRTPEELAEIGKKIGERQRGENNPYWKGGITPLQKQIRTSRTYKEWRTQVFKRDNFTCKECGVRGVELHADHIKPFALYPELRTKLSNGRTLCVPCHKKTPNYNGKGITIKLKQRARVFCA